jgi:hypothetical protein
MFCRAADGKIRDTSAHIRTLIMWGVRPLELSDCKSEPFKTPSSSCFGYCYGWFRPISWLTIGHITLWPDNCYCTLAIGEFIRCKQKSRSGKSRLLARARHHNARITSPHLQQHRVRFSYYDHSTESVRKSWQLIFGVHLNNHWRVNWRIGFVQILREESFVQCLSDSVANVGWVRLFFDSSSTTGEGSWRSYLAGSKSKKICLRQLYKNPTLTKLMLPCIAFPTFSRGCWGVHLYRAKAYITYRPREVGLAWRPVWRANA